LSEHFSGTERLVFWGQEGRPGNAKPAIQADEATFTPLSLFD
jgi:hypothetical protein